MWARVRRNALVWLWPIHSQPSLPPSSMISGFAPDSPLEGTGFEPSVPPRKRHPSREAPAADHGRLARRPVLNDANQLIGPASLVGNSRETLHKSGTDGSNPVPSSGESANHRFRGETKGAVVLTSRRYIA